MIPIIGESLAGSVDINLVASGGYPLLPRLENQGV